MKKLAARTVEGFKDDPCVYCGQVADSLDHFVPRAYRRTVEEWRKQEGWEDVPDTVPCCRSCNSIAGANVFRTLQDKREFIQECLRRKHRRVMRPRFRTNEELAEFGFSLRSHIVMREDEAVRLLRRLSWPYELEVEYVRDELSRAQGSIRAA